VPSASAALLLPESDLNLSSSSKPRRNTAEGCRERATSTLQHAQTMAAPTDRKLLGDSAASWTARADLLQRLEKDVASDNHPLAPG
jgi:hypothetical protein